MKLLLILDDEGRLMMAEHAETGLLVFRHSNETETGFLDRVRDQMQGLS
ncbi:hypothetical protein [Nitrincola sp.]